MSRLCFSSIILLCLIALSQPASAQKTNDAAKPPAPAPKQPAPASNAVSKDKTEAQAEAARVLKQRREQVRSLLVSRASDARNFRDQLLRARCLARIADALWEVDAEQARSLFRKAWEAAEVADAEGRKKLQEEIARQRTKTGGGFAVNLPPSVRPEVLRLAARRDRRLGEEFLGKLRAEREASGTPSVSLSLSGLPEAMEQRLNLAGELLGAGEVERAVQFAEPALITVSMSSIDFLSNLREKDPTAADQRYASMLAISGNNMQADANTISLLASYIFTPHFYLIFSGNGVSSSMMPGTSAPATVSPELQLAFFQTASSVLLRPTPPPEQDQSTAGLDGKYLAIKRLLPLFEQFAPRPITDAMHSQFEALSAMVHQNIRNGDDDWLQKGIRSEKKPADRLADQEQPLLDKIEHAKTSAERDGLYVDLVFLALAKDNIRARDYAGKIDESELRKQTAAFADASLVISAIDKKKPELALELARTGELTHTQRVWFLTQSAKLLAKTDHDKALGLLDDAVAEARRVEGADPDRPRVLLGIANAVKLVDPPRVWDATFDAVSAANSAEGFTGEDGLLTLTLQTKGRSSVRSNDAPDFDIEGIFGALANDDYDRAVEMARGFQGEAPRANAVIAIARAVLQAKQGSKQQPQPANKN